MKQIVKKPIIHVFQNKEVQMVIVHQQVNTDLINPLNKNLLKVIMRNQNKAFIN